MSMLNKWEFAPMSTVDLLSIFPIHLLLNFTADKDMIRLNLWQNPTTRHNELRRNLSKRAPKALITKPFRLRWSLFLDDRHE